jgi:SPOR domain
MGALALGYMTLLLFAPDLIVTSAAVQAEIEREAVPEQEVAAAPTEDAGALRETVAEQDVEGEPPAASAEAAEEEAQTAPKRLAFAEQPSESPAAPAEEPANAEPPAEAAPADPAAAAQEPARVVFEFPTATGPKLVILNSPPASPITTGSLPAPPAPPAPPAQPIDFGPATVTPAPPPVALQLGSGPSLEALQLNWSLLSEQHHSVLKDLEPRYQAVGGAGDGVTYQLMAGPIATAGEAKRVCALLRAKKVACGVGPFGGEAL